MLNANSILKTLTDNDYKNIHPFLEQMQVFFGEVLYESAEESRYIYFPISSEISLFMTLEDGSSSEIAVMDNKGGVGLPIQLKDKRMQHMAIVTKNGITYRLEKELLTPKLQSSMLNAFTIKISQFKASQFKAQGKINNFAA
jgi:hypothetical protein